MERPDWMFPEFWEAIQVFWKRPDVVKKSGQNSQNRMSEPDGPGTGISKHTGGSRSTRILQQTMSEETGKSKHELNYETFIRIHKKRDGSYITKKDARLDAEVHRIAAENGREDFNEIYLEITTPQKSQRYGTGSAGSSQLSGRSTRSTGSSASLLTQELLQTRIGGLQEQLAASIEEQRLAREEQRRDREAREALEQQLREDRVARELLQQQMAEFQRMFASGWRPPHPPPP